MNSIINLAETGLGITGIRNLGMIGIEPFLTKYKDYFNGRVLDYGCGEQPYKDLVSGKYVPYDDGYHAKRKGKTFPKYSGHFDTVLLTQVIQFLPRLGKVISSFDTDHLVITFPVNWYIVQREDLFRYTPNGLKYILRKCGFKTIVSENLSHIKFKDITFPLQHGIIAEKK